MTTLTKQAREAIKNWQYLRSDMAWSRATIAGYTRHFFGTNKWAGDRCGCVDDRCIGFHHDETDECHCLPGWLDDYAKAIRAAERAR